MGRIFETRKATMFKRWDKMSKAFTRVGREISMAVKAGGPNPDSNPALRRAVLNARACNMPKDKVEAAGSVFLGDWTPEALGDYCSGTNHVLPTNGAARAWSGVSVASFQNFVSVQSASREGIRAIGDCAVTMARAERLDAHANAVVLRLEAARA